MTDTERLDKLLGFAFRIRMPGYNACLTNHTGEYEFKTRQDVDRFDEEQARCAELEEKRKKSSGT